MHVALGQQSLRWKLQTHSFLGNVPSTPVGQREEAAWGRENRPKRACHSLCPEVETPLRVVVGWGHWSLALRALCCPVTGCRLPWEGDVAVTL